MFAIVSAISQRLNLMLTKAKNITHEHILRIINTEVGGEIKNLQKTVKILELGCGNGNLLSYLSHNLTKLQNDTNFELYGIDVTDHCIDSTLEFPGIVIASLLNDHPEIDWQSRIHATLAGQAWPFENEYFDLIISNQVLEHVDDHEQIFSESNRVLKDGGICVHLFPLKNYIYEAHVNLPYSHRISNHKLSKTYIKIMNYLGFGTYKRVKEQYNSLDDYSEETMRYLHKYTNYLTKRQLYNCAKNNKLFLEFKYTSEFYKLKLRDIFKLNKAYKYNNNRNFLIDALSLLFLKYVSSITVMLKKLPD